MPSTEQIQQELIKKLKYLEGSVKTPRPRRISVDVGLENFMQVFDFAVKQLKFDHLCTITGLDEQERLSFIYHLARVCGEGFTLSIRTSAPKQNPVIKTVMPYFPGAEIYEREIMDLLGAKVEGLPEGNRYPLTDDWPKDEFPLRKDWKPKNGEVTP